jgi:CheY-like chemotaxis protein
MKARSGRVLVVDDEAHVRQMLGDFLMAQGYEVAAVATGAQALKEVASLQPDVIMLDMMMPGLSGADVLDALRRDGITVPVILITGHQVIVREGFFAVLTKPFHVRRLGEVVAAAIAQGRTSSAALGDDEQA